MKSYMESEIESSGGGEDDDSVDAASAIYERGKTLALIGILGDKVLSIEDALRRVQKGTYGFCKMCGQRITPARLEIMPHVTLCVRCQARKEASTRHGHATIRAAIRSKEE